MKHYSETMETKTITSMNRKYLNTTCDICGKEFQDEEGFIVVNYSRVIIEHVKGESYPEETFESKLEPDICSECFEGKILPFLRSIGLKGEYEESTF